MRERRRRGRWHGREEIESSPKILRGMICVGMDVEREGEEEEEEEEEEEKEEEEGVGGKEMAREEKRRRREC